MTAQPNGESVDRLVLQEGGDLPGAPNFSQYLRERGLLLVFERKPNDDKNYQEWLVRDGDAPVASYFFIESGNTRIQMYDETNYGSGPQRSLIDDKPRILAVDKSGRRDLHTNIPFP